MQQKHDDLAMFIHMTRSLILYMDEVMIMKEPSIPVELAVEIKDMLRPVLRSLREEKRVRGF